MPVRYRPRGFDARPGRRVSYTFANGITAARGIPPKVATGTITCVIPPRREFNIDAWRWEITRGASVCVRFDGRTHTAYFPAEFLRDPETSPLRSEDDPRAPEIPLTEWADYCPACSAQTPVNADHRLTRHTLHTGRHCPGSGLSVAA